MKNNRGFTLIEALVAMSVVMMLVATIVPINILIKQERSVLTDRRMISSVLHDELQHIIWSDDAFTNHSQTINTKNVLFTYQNEKELIKGCATWENVKQRNEKICLYGYKKG